MVFLRRAAFAALALASTASQAVSVTAEELWQRWQSGVAAGGGRLEAEVQKRDGTRLELRGLRLTTRQKGIAGRTVITLDNLLFDDQGNGAVTVHLSSPLTIRDLVGPEAAAGEAVLTLTPRAGMVVVTGEGEALRYDYALPDLDARLTMGPTPDHSAEKVEFTAQFEDLSGWTFLSEAKGEKIDIGLTSGPITLAAKVWERRAAGDPLAEVVMTGAIETTAFNLTGENFVARGQALPKSTFDLRLGGLGLGTEVVEEGQKITADASLAEIDLHGSLTEKKATLALEAREARLTARMPQSGLPEGEASLDRITLSYDLPLLVSERSGEAFLASRVEGLSLSEPVWALLDRGAALSHAPLSAVVELALAVEGTGRFMRLPPRGPFPMQSGNAWSEMRLRRLDLREVGLTGLGAELRAEGGLVFDPAPRGGPLSIEQTKGKITVDLTGVASLLEDLGRAGVISAEQMLPLRMGLAMFTKPGSLPNRSVSVIEFKQKGLFINGQRIM